MIERILIGYDGGEASISATPPPAAVELTCHTTRPLSISRARSIPGRRSS